MTLAEKKRPQHLEKFQHSIGYEKVVSWMHSKKMHPFPFQMATWEKMELGECGLVNAPTGYGKTFSVFLGAIIHFINRHPQNYQTAQSKGVQLLWITPLRTLAKDIARAMEEVLKELAIPWRVAIRNGDTEASVRLQQKKDWPEILLTTPESWHLLIASKKQTDHFNHCCFIAVDEWHELLGSKRGVQIELALSHLLSQQRIASLPTASVWGISATIGNLEEAKEVLLFPTLQEGSIIRADAQKKWEVKSIFPDTVEKFPWAGHLGIKLIDKIIPIIEESTTTLLFINTRGMSEIWYQELLKAKPDWAGIIALHHGSIDRDLRNWVEENLHTGKLKLVVCTASLDLGVDFRPVETVIQVGSPKGVSRFLQRAGRSGHQPDAVSKIYFLPTHSLELLEAAALKDAIKEQSLESRDPLIECYDVLIQFCCTVAVGDGFYPHELFKTISNTYCYNNISEDAWHEILRHITIGGNALQQYDEYKKVEVEDGLYIIRQRGIAMRHRMHIGTIVSDAMLKVQWFTGGYIGVIEEYFISRLEPGDCFTLAGRNLELVMIKDMTVLVRKSTAKKTQIPSWVGGRMPLTAQLGKQLRKQLNYANTSSQTEEIQALHPLLALQQKISYVPHDNELLIEHIETKDGFHLFVYPFEGRLVHEAMAAILAYRLSKIRPITFSFAMNDYGFELLSDQPIPLDDSNVYELFSTEDLLNDIQRSVNSTEMAKRKFRDIAVIGGLVFQGFPGAHKKARHLQSSASLLFNVFQTYDKDQLLLRQAYQEVMTAQMEEARLRDMLQRIQTSKIIIQFPEKLTPFCFPIKVDSMREDLSSEKLEDRVRKMQDQLEKQNG